MHAENFVLADYLQRIGLTHPPEKSLQSLTDIMRAQLRTVPFENLDVQAGKIVSLVPEEIVSKIIYSGRGGYCYEVNGIFSMALSALGFNYQVLGARPMFYPQRRPKTHMILLVECKGQQWVCDTGFGSFGLRAPVGLHQLDEPVVQDNETFQLTKSRQGEYVLGAWVKGDWANQYCFDLYPMEWVDFVPANYFNSTHPDAVFVQRYLIMLQTDQGRKLLSGTELKQWIGADNTTSAVTPEALDEILWREFRLRRP